jgi:hypothetical protein
MSCVPTLTTWLMRQSNEASAASRRGQPVAPVCQSAAAKRSVHRRFTAKQVRERLLSGAQGIDAQGAVSLNVGHTERRGSGTPAGWAASVTLQTALAVKPAGPPGHRW